MTELTTTQKIVLQAAADRENGSIHPMPTNIRGGAAANVTVALVAKHLIDENGVITTLGLDAMHPDWNAKPESTDDAPATTEMTLADAEKAYVKADAAYETAAKAFQDADDALNKAIRKGKSQAIIEQAREAMIAAKEAANQSAEAAMIAQAILDNFAATTEETPTALATIEETSTALAITEETSTAIVIDDESVPTIETGDDFEGDVAAAEQALTEKHTQASEADERALIALLETIARRHLSFETLETRMSDSLDYRDVSVWCIRNALIAAYEAGLQVTKKPATRKTPKTASDKAPRDNKKSMVMAMLARPDGATIEQIADATNWQTHTIRSFLSIAKKKGTNIEMMGTNTEGSRIYHIAA